MSFRVYVAAPYIDAIRVREAHTALRAVGIEPVSTWAERADGPEALEALTVAERHRIAAANDHDLLSAHAVLVLARDGAGAEMFAEVRIALEYGIPVVWVGSRRPLSAYRPGVVRVEEASEGIAQLGFMAEVVRRPWPVHDDEIRDVLWDLIEHVEGTSDVRHEEARHVA